MLRLLSALLFAWVYLDCAYLLAGFTTVLILLEVNSTTVQYSTAQLVVQCVLGPLLGCVFRHMQQLSVLSVHRFSIQLGDWPRQALVCTLMLMTLLPYDRDVIDERPEAIPLGIIISGLLTMLMAWFLELSRHNRRTEKKRPQEEWTRFSQRFERLDIKLAIVQWLVITVDLWAFELRPVWYCAVLFGSIAGVWLVAFGKDMLCIVVTPYDPVAEPAADANSDEAHLLKTN